MVLDLQDLSCCTSEGSAPAKEANCQPRMPMAVYCFELTTILESTVDLEMLGWTCDELGS